MNALLTPSVGVDLRVDPAHRAAPLHMESSLPIDTGGHGDPPQAGSCHSERSEESLTRAGKGASEGNCQIVILNEVKNLFRRPHQQSPHWAREPLRREILRYAQDDNLVSVQDGHLPQDHWRIAIQQLTARSAS